MSSASPAACGVATLPASRPLAGERAWLVGPWFDLLLIANIGWPIAMLIAYDGNPWLKSPLTFVQAYFLSSPHRWITLLLVFCDPERFWKEPVRFGGIGLGLITLGVTLVCVGAYSPGITDSLMLLMMLDYAWNSWHFAAQHAGIARIYSRVTKQQLTEKQVEFERVSIRLLVLWAFFRLAILMGTDRLSPEMGFRYDAMVSLNTFIGWLDPLFMLPMAVLLVRELRSYTHSRLGRLVYVASVGALYGGWLLALHSGQRHLMSGLFIASAIFHATEYLSIVNWSVRKKSSGIWRYRISRTGVGVIVFMLVIGLAHVAVDSRYAYGLALVTLLVSLLHYGYDGMIWRSRPKPKVV